MIIKLFSTGDGEVYATSVKDAHDTIGGSKKDIKLITISSVCSASCDRSRVGITLSNRVEKQVIEYESSL